MAFSRVLYTMLKTCFQEKRCKPQQSTAFTDGKSENIKLEIKFKLEIIVQPFLKDSFQIAEEKKQGGRGKRPCMVQGRAKSWHL